MVTISQRLSELQIAYKDNGIFVKTLRAAGIVKNQVLKLSLILLESSSLEYIILTIPQAIFSFGLSWSIWFLHYKLSTEVREYVRHLWHCFLHVFIWVFV